MKIFITSIHAIILAVLYASSISATPFQIDFSIHWNVSQSLAQFSLTEIESFRFPSFISSDDVDEFTALQAQFRRDYDPPALYLLSTRKLYLADARNNSRYSLAGMLHPASVMDIYELTPGHTGKVFNLVDVNKALSFDTVVNTGDIQLDIAKKDSSNTMMKPSASSFFPPAKQMQSPAVPDPRPLWLVGIILGFTGLTWRLWNLSAQGDSVDQRQ